MNPDTSTPSELQDDLHDEIGWVMIPPEVLCAKNLCAGEKMVCGRVMGLLGKRGYCFASNEWIGSQLGYSERTVEDYISKLVKKGFLYRKYGKKGKGDRRLSPTPFPDRAGKATLTEQGSIEVSVEKGSGRTPKLLEEAPNGASSKSATSPFQEFQNNPPKPTVETLRKFPDQTPEQIVERLRACIVDAKSESHPNRVGLFGDLLLSHEASPAFVEAVGDFSKVYPVIAQIQTKYPWAMMIDMWSARLPWKRGVTEWKAYLWGAVRGYYPQWSGEQEVSQKEVNNAIPERFERLLGEVHVRSGDLPRLGDDAQPAFNLCIESVGSGE